MKISGNNALVCKAARRQLMLSAGVSLQSKVANTQDAKKSAKKDRRNWKKNMERDW